MVDQPPVSGSDATRLDPTAATRLKSAGNPDATAPTLAGDPNAATAQTVVGSSSAKPLTLDALLGSTVGGCRIQSLLGRGGMGAVFKANQERLNREVALKVMLPEHGADAQFAERFVREARTVAALNHPNVVQVYDAGADPQSAGMLYMVMEYVRGRTFNQVIKAQGALPVPLVLAVMRQAADGLDAAHACRLVHRDIKPENLMVDAGGRVKVMDFGLARPGNPGDSGLTTPGMILGTPNYISPEGARGEATDIRSDLYSIGVSMWQAIAGKLPFSAPTPVQVMVHHLETAPPDLAQVSGCPRPVADLVARLIAKDPAQRLQDPAALSQAIAELEQQLCGESVRLAWAGERLVTTSQLRAAAAKPQPRRSGLALAGAAVLAGIVMAAWLLLRQPAQPVPLPGPTPARAPAPAPTRGVAGSYFVKDDSTKGKDSDAGEAKAAVQVAQVDASSDLDRGTLPVSGASQLEEVATIEPRFEAATARSDAFDRPLAASDQQPAASFPQPPSLPVQPPLVVAPPAVPAAVEQPAVALPRPTVAAVPAIGEPRLVNRLNGSLSVTSIPPGATVYIDGRSRGVTPLLVRDLLPGRHGVRLVKDDAIDEESVVVITGGVVTRLINPLPQRAYVELADLPAGASASVGGVAYEAGMETPSGSSEIVVFAGGAVIKRSTVTLAPGPNTFAFGRLAE